MRIFLALVLQYLKEHRLATLIWMGVIALVSYGVAAVTPSVTQGNLLQQIAGGMPAAMQRLYGNIFVFKYPADAYLQFKWLLFLPVLTAIFGTISALGIVSREIERRTADFLLALPISRARLLMARFAALALTLVALFAASHLVIWASLRSLHIPASFAGYAAFFAGQLFLMLPLSALALWLSLFLKEHASATRYILLIAVLPYLLELANRIAGGPRWLGWLLLYGLVDAENIIARGAFPWAAVCVGTILTMILLGFANRGFERKQIPA